MPRITTAPEPLGDDIARRARRYLWQMGLRLVCFLLAIVVEGPARWVLLAGAVVLPYIAVVLANAGRERDVGAPAAMLGPVELPAAPERRTPPTEQEHHPR